MHWRFLPFVELLLFCFDIRFLFYFDVCSGPGSPDLFLSETEMEEKLIKLAVTLFSLYRFGYNNDSCLSVCLSVCLSAATWRTGSASVRRTSPASCASSAPASRTPADTGPPASPRPPRGPCACVPTEDRASCATKVGPHTHRTTDHRRDNSMTVKRD